MMNFNKWFFIYNFHNNCSMKFRKTGLLITALFIIAVTSLEGQEKNHIKFDNQDFKIIVSNNSYLEVEFYPQYTSKNILSFNFETKSFEEPGNPDVSYRGFPVFLPVKTNNSLEIIDYKYDAINNIDVNPVPTPEKSEKDKEIIYKYNKNQDIYNKNSFYPQEIGDLGNVGTIRNRYFTSAKIYPIQYNPVSKVLRKYSYIRFRINFGGNPLPLTKKLSVHELDFFKNLAINSKTAINWSTVEFNSITDKPTRQNSVLSSGDFYKIEIKESGIYKIDKQYLQNAGINVNNIDPRTIKIYGNGGSELPFNNSTPVPNDLVENRIIVIGQDDGIFNDNDYILFYGRSPNEWIYSTTANRYVHTINHYSTSNFYFITYGGNFGLRMDSIYSSNVPGLTPVQYFTDKFFEEPEINNLGSTGTLWLSQRIGTGESFVFNKTLEGYVPGSQLTLSFRFGNGSATGAYFLIKDDNSNFSNLIYLNGVSPGSFSHIITHTVNTSYALNSGNNMNLSLSLPSQYNNPNLSGYYDYYEVLYNRYFSSVVNNYFRFNAVDTFGVVEYQISTFTTPDIKLFDVTSITEPNTIIPISYNNGIVRFQENYVLYNKKEYYIVGGNNYKTPFSISSKIANQNLHGISDGASFIIISPKEFFNAAYRLKAQREIQGYNYLKTLIVDIKEIYNEFSGGLLDPVAPRNFLKYAFNKWTERPVYILFLGDGSYDFKNIYNLSVENYLPTIQKSNDESNEIVSYPSDDFVTDINENFPSPGWPLIGRPDFSSGRICVNTLNDANNVIDKIINYETPSNLNTWRKKVLYVADDGWTTTNTQGQEGALHTQQSEDIAEVYTPKLFEKEKIYIVTYPAIFTPQGRRKPGANIDIIKKWNDGTLAINYVGHGSTDLWAHEHIFVKDESIPQLTNVNKYPLVTIASCDLARWDDPFVISAAEQLVFVQDKGAIGVIAAVRPVYATENATFNNTLWNNYMYQKDTMNLPIRIGKALYNTKNQLPVFTDGYAKYCLIGDPTLRVGIPQYFTRIDSINNSTGIDTVKALQHVRISGSILKPDSSFWSDYNGNISLKVYDVDKYITFFDFGYPFYFRLDGGTIFIGKTSVTNGRWAVEFIVPKDISYETGRGKIQAYFWNSFADGAGFSNNIVLNGLDENAPIDTVGPQITIFMGDRNFRSGDIINQNTKIIVDLFDYSGINLTGTIGHKIEAVMNNDENNKIDLTHYYNSTSGYQYGTLEYPIENLQNGKYTLKVIAWDTYNNFSENEIEFKVYNTSDLKVENIYNYPNPMKDNTSFLYQHNFDVPLTTQIRIYTVSGRLIKEINVSNITDKFVKIDWDGKDADGDAIANGIYLYKIIIKSEDGTLSYNSTGKLAKLK